MSIDDYDLQSLLDDAQDIGDESFVARALLQPETDPWERFPLGLLYPTHDPFNEAHHSFLIGSTADSLTTTESTIKSELVEDFDLLSTVSQHQCDFELDKYLNFTHESPTIASPTATVSLSSSPIDNSDALLLHSDQEPAGYSCFKERLEYPDTSTSPATAILSSSSPTETAPLLQPEPELAEYLCFTDHPDDTVTTPVTDGLSPPSVADTSPTTSRPSSFTSGSFHGQAPTGTASPPTPIASPSSSSFGSSFASNAIPPTSSPELSSSGPPDINAEDLHLSHVALNEGKHASPHAVDHDGPLLEEPSVNVHYTFVDPHEKTRKRRTQGIKNSTPIACTFCRRRKIRCGGPQESGGVYRAFVSTTEESASSRPCHTAASDLEV
ncbi:hypothetical protein BC629DRAFT_1592201 [Irpex lacteus]|nr:hypothetical protein BC629DRAFT_1592201 [Irpex lacteus]